MYLEQCLDSLLMPVLVPKTVPRHIRLPGRMGFTQTPQTEGPWHLAN